MSIARSITKQLKKTYMSIALLPSSYLSPSSSGELFTTTAQSSIRKAPSFRLLPFSSSSSSSSYSSPSPYKSPFFSSSSSFSKHNSAHGAYFTIIRGISSLPPQSTVKGVVNHHPSPSSSSYLEQARDSNSRSININNDDHHLRRASIPVRAFFLSNSIDLKSLVDENQLNFVSPTTSVTNHVVLRFSGGNHTNSHPDEDLEVSFLSGKSNHSFVVVFQYGSIVMFNILDREVDRYLKIIQRHVDPELHPGRISKDRKEVLLYNNDFKYEVREKPNLPVWMQGGWDSIVLQHLNLDGVRIIGSVIAQSVALDYYVRQVDGLVAEYTDVNLGLVKTGTFTTGGLLKLFKFLKRVGPDIIHIDHKLRLFKSVLRLEIAWGEDAKYFQMWESLNDRFELTRRFAGLDFMLRLAKVNTRFLGEELVNRAVFRAHLVLLPSFAALFVTPLFDSMMNFIFLAIS